MKPAAIAGSFADVKFVRTRSVMQIVVEIPIEHADAALAALGGVPQPGAERPVAVARLDANATVAQPPDSGAGANPSPAATVAPQVWAEMKPSKQAGIRCNDVRFQRWLGAMTVGHAADIVRGKCCIDSRGELDRDEKAAREWRAMDGEYRAWIETEGREDFL
jgi:hypothetical protein